MIAFEQVKEGVRADLARSASEENVHDDSVSCLRDGVIKSVRKKGSLVLMPNIGNSGTL